MLNSQPYDATLLDPAAPLYPHDLADVKGHATFKRALEVAAAGGHNVLLLGPPGSSKTMMARRLPSILPPLSLEEALETTKLYTGECMDMVVSSSPVAAWPGLEPVLQKNRSLCWLRLNRFAS